MKGRMKKVANQILPGTGGLLARTGKTAKHQRHQARMASRASASLQTYGERLLAAYQSGNEQDRVQVLADLYSEANGLRATHHFHTLPRTQFLEQMRHFLESRGLVLDSVITRRFQDKLRRKSCATV